MSRAILPGARVRTSNQKARVGIRHARGEVPADQTQPDPEPDTVTTTPDETQAEPQPCTESNAAVRLVRVDAGRALLELRCSCGKTTLIWLTQEPAESPGGQGKVQQTTTANTEREGQ